MKVQWEPQWCNGTKKLPPYIPRVVPPLEDQSTSSVPHAWESCRSHPSSQSLQGSMYCSLSPSPLSRPRGLEWAAKFALEGTWKVAGSAAAMQEQEQRVMGGNGRPWLLLAPRGDSQMDREEPPPHIIPGKDAPVLGLAGAKEIQPLSSPRVPQRQGWGQRRVTGLRMRGGSESVPFPGDLELITTGAGAGHRALLGGVPAPIRQFLAHYPLCSPCSSAAAKLSWVLPPPHPAPPSLHFPPLPHSSGGSSSGTHRPGQ